MATDPRPGFQGSETSYVEVIIYQHGGDPVLLSSVSGKFSIDGRHESENHCVVGVSTNKSLGAPSGTFSVSIKPGRQAEEIFQWLADDDWIDIIFWKHKKPWHVMRGLIDGMQRSRTVKGVGAESRTYTITGRDFAKIWESTPVWFSPYADNDLVTDAISNQVFQALPQIVGAPPRAVKAFLRNFLEELAGSAGVNWTPPPGMIGIKNESFLESVTFAPESSGEITNPVFTPSYLYQNIPPRKQFNPNYMNPSGTLWQLAYQHSDPLFTELYADLFPDGDPISSKITEGSSLDLTQTKMTVVIRDKPFPTMEFRSLWDDLPLLKIPRQQIVEENVGKGGNERFNAYFIASLLFQESIGPHALSILAPLVHMQEIKRHGMRRMDVQSSMAPDDLDFSKMSKMQRRICRDWYCLNPYLLSGSISLAIGRPDIKIGCRIEIPNDGRGLKLDETYYVEQVSHSWEFGRGMKTQLGVTRGWQGDDVSYADKLSTVIDSYKTPNLIRDTEGFLA